jgi:hypothetical protein
VKKSLLTLITLVALGVSGAVVPVYADQPPPGCYYGQVETPGFFCSGGICCPALRYEDPTGSVVGAVDEARPVAYLDVPAGRHRQLDTFDAGITLLLLEFLF